MSTKQGQDGTAAGRPVHHVDSHILAASHLAGTMTRHFTCSGLTASSTVQTLRRFLVGRCVYVAGVYVSIYIQ
jgi:hypothetical protein